MSNSSSDSDLDRLRGLYSAVRTVKAIFASGADAHAILLFGEEGAGKTELARSLARFWLCPSPTPAGGCGACSSCQALERGVASDVLHVYPRGASHWIRLPAVQEVSPRPPEYEDVLPIQTHVRTPALRSKRKVVWIEDADRLYAEASHALLKTLEEPPPHVRFVLATTAISRVRATIRSRCLPVPCELPTREDWQLAFPDLEEWEQALARRSPGRLARLRETPEIYRGVFELARETLSARMAEALALTQRLRALVDAVGKSDEVSARRAGTQVLQAFAVALAHFGASRAMIARAVESHRRTAGNASSGVEFDALFASLLGRNWVRSVPVSGVLA